MRAQSLRLWERLRGSYWFLPSVIAIFFAILSIVLVWVDAEYGPFNLGWLYSGGPEAARELMGVIAGSMITVTGVVFSITIVALTLASQQFGPRLLYNFMRNTPNQVVLGVFVANFLYCLIVLRTIRYGEDGSFVPNLAVSGGVLLTVTSVGVLIFFIHHISTSIKAESIISEVAEEMHDTIDRIFPADLGRDANELPANMRAAFRGSPNIPPDAATVYAQESGYIQAIENKALLGLAMEHDAVLYLPHRPGHFVVKHNALVLVDPPDRLTSELADAINETFILGPRRTPTQDVEYAFDQLVEIAVRALSPGVNDPFTALTCIDQIGTGLARLAEHRFPSPDRYDVNNRLRIVARTVTFGGLTDTGLNLIRQYGASTPTIAIRLLEIIAAVAPHTRFPEDRKALLAHVDKLRHDTQAISESHDMRDLRERHREARAALHAELA